MPYLSIDPDNKYNPRLDMRINYDPLEDAHTLLRMWQTLKMTTASSSKVALYITDYCYKD
jgi:hypothetical protein